MMVEMAQLSSLVAALLWPLARISGLMLTAPIFSSRTIPTRIKMAIVVMLTLVLMPLAPPPGDVDPLSLSALITMMQQVVVGAAMGFALKLAFEALVLGGAIVASTMGLGFAEVMDPQQGRSTPVLGQLYLTLASLIFLTMDGHLRVVALLATGLQDVSWQAMSPGGDTLWGLLQFASQLFAGAVLVALPAVGSLLVVNFGFGAISRAAPSMNLFSIGFPISICLGLVVIWLGLQALPGTFDSLQNVAFLVARMVSGG